MTVTARPAGGLSPLAALGTIAIVLGASAVVARRNSPDPPSTSRAEPTLTTISFALEKIPLIAFAWPWSHPWAFSQCL